ncbi:beta-L-arabinofuranosidase domain-containing protein [Allomuricauda sp. SCSIO 65647]|uniref:beta-L-arabinofuranosidase domain-containing protein n=1 Tax=Allomuricauda sp. SCSIO 65647 TaxID=2908843 RepID=UPI001F2D5BB1|nr:beta-L-arabinofuranosidase domain-containing protein [Muricauda sp. SCSIO 65647]UJH68899.1 glycoside hydrolase family 127 protein [Muricauda sp. SCSIO 65647]
MKKISIMLLVILSSCKEPKENSQGENFSKNVHRVAEQLIDDSDKLQFFKNKKNPIKTSYQPFETGSVLPKGWILEMMENDLEKGIVGALDELYPGITSDDLYHMARRGGMEDIPEMGDLVLTGQPWETSIMWWNAETIGNWWEGFIRHAFLTKNETAIEQSHEIVRNLLNSADEDGYIGIYKPNLRYQHDGSNGELWAQTTAFRTMLAYYGFTNNEKVLKAVERAMALTMQRYGKNGRNPFQLKNAFGGATHGLMLTDVCETLYRITNKAEYQDYATYLYEAFSTFSINRSFNDLRYPFLAERDSLFQGHGVHTYEHIRSMVNAYYNTGYPELKEAHNNMIAKLEPCILPSGAGHGDEWISKLTADPDKTAAEYCGMLELRNSYGSLLEKTGEVQFADAAEKLTYNAMLGARNHDGTAITYSKHDNCYAVDGKHHEEDRSANEPRYKYSPTHSEPAVCCVPNYGRNLPYFLDQMYMKFDDGIAILMYGPSELTAPLDDATIIIRQKTDYPWTNKVTFEISATRPKTFTLRFRKPEWSESVTFSGVEAVNSKNGFYEVAKTWPPDETFAITFNNPIKVKPANNDQVYLQKGPLVFAHQIPHKEKTIKTYGDTSFKDYYCLPENEDHKNLVIPENANFKSIEDGELALKGELFDTSRQKEVEATLVPMGKTVLRRVTFPEKKQRLQ